jgi:hypothetical protein
MGITIHFEGRLTNDAAYERLMSSALDFARGKGWRSNAVHLETAERARVRDEEPWDYVGPIKGLSIEPHEKCDPLLLEFDDGLFMQDYVKTQFAPPDVHVAIVDLLRQVEDCFVNLTVEDEGEYWDSGDVERLAANREAFFDAFEEHLATHPNSRGPLRMDNGRIVDIIE